MVSFGTPSISVKEQFYLEAKPDVALVKLYVLGEGMLLVDAVENVRKKVAEISETVKSGHPQVERIDTFDIHLGDKEERLRGESALSPRPLIVQSTLIVQGILITASPQDPAALHRIMDVGIKHGALLNAPHHRFTYLSSNLDSALLFGLRASERHEGQAVEQCIKRAEARCRALATCAGRRVGQLIEVSDVVVEATTGSPFRKDFAHISGSFPTRFLSPTPDKVVICASLTARYELLEDEKRTSV